MLLGCNTVQEDWQSCPYKYIDGSEQDKQPVKLQARQG